MKYKSKLPNLNPGILMPVYVLLWPFLYALVQIDALSYYIDTSLLLIDARLSFYFLALGLCILKFFPGNQLQREQLLSLTILIAFIFLYLLSFLFNLSVPGIDLHQFINGFLLFSILVAYSVLYSDLIDWYLVAKIYAFSLLISTLFGFYAFSRFTYLGIEVLSSPSLSSELFRLVGNKGYWLNSILILAFIFFDFKYNSIKSAIVNASLILSNIIVVISSQRNAITVLVYELLIFSRYYSLNQFLIMAGLLVAVISAFSKQILTLLDVTFIQRLKIEQSIDGGRFEIWRATLDALTSNIKHLVFGVSEGGLPAISGDSWPLVGSDHPHSLLLYFWASTGLGGLFLIIVVIGVIAYFIHGNRMLHQILFYWLFVFSLVFVGFVFYEKYSKSDFLNLGIVTAFSLLLRQQESRLDKTQLDFTQNSTNINERYS